MIQLEHIQSGDTVETMVTKLNHNFEQISVSNGGHMGPRGFDGIPGIPGLNGIDGEAGLDGDRGSNVIFITEWNTPQQTVAEMLALGYSENDVWYTTNDNYWWRIVDGVWESNSVPLTLQDTKWRIDKIVDMLNDPPIVTKYNVFKNTAEITESPNGPDLGIKYLQNILIGGGDWDNTKTESEMFETTFNRKVLGISPSHFKIQLTQTTPTIDAPDLIVTPANLKIYDESISSMDMSPLIYLGQTDVTDNEINNQFGVSMYSKDASTQQLLYIGSGETGVNSNEIYLGVNQVWTDGSISINAIDADTSKNIGLVVRDTTPHMYNLFNGIQRFTTPTPDAFSTDVTRATGVETYYTGINGGIKFNTSKSNILHSNTEITPSGYIKITGDSGLEYKIDKYDHSSAEISMSPEEVLKFNDDKKLFIRESTNSYIKSQEYSQIYNPTSGAEITTSVKDIYFDETNISYKRSYKDGGVRHSVSDIFEVCTLDVSEDEILKLSINDFGIGINGAIPTSDRPVNINGPICLFNNSTDIAGIGINTDTTSASVYTGSSHPVSKSILNVAGGFAFFDSSDLNVDGMITTNNCLTIGDDDDELFLINSDTPANATKYRSSNVTTDDVGIFLRGDKKLRFNDSGANTTNHWKIIESTNAEGDTKWQHHEAAGVPWFTLQLYPVSSPVPVGWKKVDGTSPKYYYYNNTDFTHPDGGVQFVTIPPLSDSTLPSTSFCWIVKVPMADGIYSGTPANYTYINPFIADDTMFPTIITESGGSI